MKKNLRIIIMIAAVALTLLMSTGCIRQNYIMFEDGDFDGIEFSDYDLIQNAELDMDDLDRNWRFLVVLKIIKRRERLDDKLLTDYH